MSLSTNDFPRGSEWRQWDLHVHTPASFHWKGNKFDSNPDAQSNRILVDEMIHALNSAEPAVFALMDYWTFDGWLALRRRLKEPGAPKLLKTVFPGIELRLMAPMTARLNAHVLFSDEITDQELQDFKSALNIEFVNRSLSDASLVLLARAVSDDKLNHHGFKKIEVDSNDSVALRAGSTIAEINSDSYKRAIDAVPDGQALGFMPFDTNDGLADIKWTDHYAYFFGLVKSTTIFESRNADVRGAFINEETAGNAKFVDKFQYSLGNTPRLVVSGSDAHCFIGVKGDNDKRGYGDFPSGKITWIKADPTFRGLLQAIKEPVKRSYIGRRPPKQDEISSNKTFFIDRVSIAKQPGTPAIGTWLDGSDLPMNSDLVAIIGNKGSGKSALADVIALLGNSRQKTHFSFLKKERFRGKSGEPAKNFVGTLTWLDGTNELRNLNDDPPSEKAELVRYIPQGHFEDLCNAHVSGQSDAFEKELRAVIFSHAGDSIRLGALDFDQLIQQQESSFRIQLNEFRKDLRGLNQEIAGFEEQLQPEVKNSLNELLSQKARQIDEHKKNQPPTPSNLPSILSPAQEAAAKSLEEISVKLRDLDNSVTSISAAEAVLAGKTKAIQNVRERLRLLERSHKQFIEDTSRDLLMLGLTATDLITLTIDTQTIDNLSALIPDELANLKITAINAASEKVKFLDEQRAIKTTLDTQQLRHQQDLKAVADWTTKLNELEGTPDAPETLKGLNSRITQLNSLPSVLKARQELRMKLSGEIFDILDSQRKSREELFKPVQDLIQENVLIREEYKLQFQATLGGSADSVADSLFSLIKQNSGEFRGEDESYIAVRKLAERYTFSKREDVIGFITALHEKIIAAANSARPTFGITSILRKDKNASEVYDLLFGLPFLEPRYTLLFQDAQIEQLSPGQRGALLLIFYLLVDKGRTPIVLDQPEENLDNETVVSLLVPVLTEAKKRRQIIMVTHNPNLAVVCDAEQIIWSTFDRKNSSKITYSTGSIENPTINAHVVKILEGTMPAFNNRKSKYH